MRWSNLFVFRMKRWMMPNKLVRVSIHIEQLKYGKVPDLQKPTLKDQLSNDAVLKQAESLNLDQIGLHLTYPENRALFAVQTLLDATDYKGNTAPISLNGSKDFPDTVPSLDISTTDYLDAYGVKYKKSNRRKMEYSVPGRRSALAALDSLSKKRHLIVYERKFEEQADGRTGNSTIEMVSTLLLDLKRDGRQLTITPNPILIDQIDTYFCWFPVDLFTALVPSSDRTKALFAQYLLFLFEMERRKGKNSKYTVRRQSDSLAYAVRLDALITARQRTRLRDLLNELYAFGASIKFLRKYEVDVDGTSVAKVDVLHLNATYFANQRKGLVPQVAESISVSSEV